MDKLKNTQEFRNEMRVVGIKHDPWGTAMEAFFECAAHMYLRGLAIPEEWAYKPSPFMATVDYDDVPEGADESYWYPLFKGSSDQVLSDIGDLLHRYTNMLDRHGKSY